MTRTLQTTNSVFPIPVDNKNKHPHIFCIRGQEQDIGEATLLRKQDWFLFWAGEHLPPFFLIFSFFDLITSSIEFTTVTTKQSFETATKGEGKETGKPKGMGKLKAFITIIIYCFITPMRGGIGERGRDAYTRSTTPCLRTSGREHRCLSFLSIISFSLCSTYTILSCNLQTHLPNMVFTPLLPLRIKPDCSPP